jgi:hypothetical protein
MNHTEYIKQTKKMSEASLRYIIKDCQEAIEANHDNPKNGDYADEICYCGMELKRRERV